MDLREKVIHALGSALQIDQTILEEDDGLIGFVVSPDFRGRDSFDRQAMILNALRAPGAQLSPEEIRQVVAVVAFTPEEYALHGPEMQRSA